MSSLSADDHVAIAFHAPTASTSQGYHQKGVEFCRKRLRGSGALLGLFRIGYRYYQDCFWSSCLWNPLPLLIDLRRHEGFVV